MKSFKPLFKNKKFVYLWISQFTSQIAMHTLNFLVILLIFQETGSPIATSLVWLAFIVPALTFAPLASAFVDFYDKRKVMMLANAAQALVVLSYALVQNRFVYLSFGVVLMYSFFNQFYIPAEISSLPQLVKEKYLPQANGLFMTTYQVAFVAGFTIAGVVGDLIGFRTAFVFGSAILGIAFIAVTLLPSLKPEEEIKKDFKQNFMLFYNGIIEAIGFIRKHQQIYLPFVTIIVLQVSLAISVVSMPIIAKEILDINPNYSGVAISTPAAIGALLGILLVSKAQDRGVRKKTLIEYAVIGMNISIWSLVSFVVYLPFLVRLFVALGFFVLVGTSFTTIFISSQTLLQTHTPTKLMARVFGDVWFFTTIATVFPLMFSATINELLGTRALFSLFGLVLLAGLVYYKKKVKYIEFKIKKYV